MPVFIAALLGGLVSAAGSFVGRAMIALGIGYVSYSGLSTLLNGTKAMVMGNLTGAPTKVVQIIGMLKVDVAISIIFSALAIRWVLAGLQSDAVKKMVIK